MSKKIKKFMKHAVENLNGAIEADNPKLTLAVLVNLQDVLDSYIEQAQKENR